LQYVIQTRAVMMILVLRYANEFTTQLQANCAPAAQYFYTSLPCNTHPTPICS